MSDDPTNSIIALKDDGFNQVKAYPTRLSSLKGKDKDVSKKIFTVDYVCEGTPYTKFGTNPPTEGFWVNG